MKLVWVCHAEGVAHPPVPGPLADPLLSLFECHGVYGVLQVQRCACGLAQPGHGSAFYLNYTVLL